MNGPILSGGIIVLVAVALWLVYLVPTWASRARFSATERNAMRLGRALRVLAETSEVPGEVQFELDTRTAYEQQKAARRIEGERIKLARANEAERVKLARAAAAEQARLERETDTQRHLLELERTRMQAEAAHAAVAAERAALAHERADLALAVARESARRRRIRARRTVRIVATALTAIGVTAVGLGTWTWASLGVWSVIPLGLLAVGIGLSVLRRVEAVSRRNVMPAAVVAEQPVEVRERPAVVIPADEPAPTWTPRRLPAQLSSVSGSAAAVAQDTIDARAALRRAALEEIQRQRAAELAPPDIASARNPQPEPLPMTGTTDDQVREYVAQLLASRAAS